MQWSEYSGIHYLAQKQTGAQTAVILFHGYGADASDLAPLAAPWRVQEAMDFYFPQGVLEVPIGPMMTGRGWFSLVNRDWDALMRGAIDDSAFTQEALATLTQVQNFLNHVATDYENVFVGGFSQGAILTSHTFYRCDFVPKGLLLLSGYLVSPSQFPLLPDALKVEFIQAHGRQDPVLPLSGARQLYEKLESLGLSGSFIEFPGGHEIPPTVVEGVREFIEDRL